MKTIMHSARYRMILLIGIALLALFAMTTVVTVTASSNSFSCYTTGGRTGGRCYNASTNNWSINDADDIDKVKIKASGTAGGGTSYWVEFVCTGSGQVAIFNGNTYKWVTCEGNLLKGDANVDGEVNYYDVWVMDAHNRVSNATPLSLQGEANADLNCDRVVTVHDTYLVIDHILYGVPLVECE